MLCIFCKNNPITFRMTHVYSYIYGYTVYMWIRLFTELVLLYTVSIYQKFAENCDYIKYT